MQTLNSILTLSQDFDYGELIRMNYDFRPVETCFLPFFAEAIPLVQEIKPDAIFLHLKPSDFESCSSFLKQLIAVQQDNPGYTPRIFVSSNTAIMLHQLLASQTQHSWENYRTLRQDQFIRMEEFSSEVLIEIFELAIESIQAGQASMNSILTTMTPLDLMAPAIAG